MGIAIFLIVLAAIALFVLRAITVHGEIIIASKNFTESRVLVEIMAQTIENNTGLAVNRRELGSTSLCYDALHSGTISIYPEYTGTLLTDVFKMPPAAEAMDAFTKVKERLNAAGVLEMLPPFGFNDTYVLVMKADVAQKKRISKISDLVTYTEFKAGFTSEFNQRPDGYPGLSKHYGLRFRSQPIDLAPGHMYGACAQGLVQVISAFSTDARIAKFGLITLADDKAFFPAYQAVPLVNKKIMRAYPAALVSLESLAGKISDSTMLQLNYQVDIKGLPVKEAARRFLAQLKKNSLRKD